MCRFHMGRQVECQSVANFVCLLKRQVSSCNYADQAKVMMRDQFVLEIADEIVRRKPLSEPKLTFAIATKIAILAEQVNVDAASLKLSAKDSGNVHVISHSMWNSTGSM